MREPPPHQPVLYQEIIHELRPYRTGRYVDGTVGAGGHAFGILEASSPDGSLLGLDIDPYALEIAKARLAVFAERVILVRASYSTIKDQLDTLGWESVQGILIDLGLSSMQVDTPDRGFSFQQDAPLDMRFDPSNLVTAADLVNHLPESELADLLYRYGEERRSRQVAKAIVLARPIDTTLKLAAVVSSATHSGRPGIHPATRTFQALRIVVNQELDVLEDFLPQAVSCLAPQGRLAVVAYHSLEDRMVKRFFRQESKDCLCPPKQPICTCGHKASISEVTRHPIQPQADEVRNNPRARSARLRIAERIAI
jgi:16S rRNA (cytosine1402-N4)-methyltransferase